MSYTWDSLTSSYVFASHLCFPNVLYNYFITNLQISPLFSCRLSSSQLVIDIFYTKIYLEILNSIIFLLQLVFATKYYLRIVLINLKSKLVIDQLTSILYIFNQFSHQNFVIFKFYIIIRNNRFVSNSEKSFR